MMTKSSPRGDPVDIGDVGDMESDDDSDSGYEEAPSVLSNVAAMGSGMIPIATMNVSSNLCSVDCVARQSG
jgi:hypothetical protein